MAIRVIISDTAPLYPPSWGGPRRIWNLYSGLGDGFDVTYVGIDCGLRKKYIARNIDPCFREIIRPVTKLYYLFRFFDLVLLRNKVFDLFVHLCMRFDSGFTREITSHDADILIAAHPWVSPCFRTRKDSVFLYDAHNCEYVLTREILKGRWYRVPVSLCVNKIERAACRRAAAILVSSEEDKKSLMKLYAIKAGKIRVVPSGAALGDAPSARKKLSARARLNISGVRPVVLFVGSLYGPNIDAARYLVDEIAPRMPEALIVVVGTVSAYFKAAAAPENVMFTGTVSDAQLRDWLSAADIGLNPVSSGSGMNIKMLDYFASGLPVISTPAGVRGIAGANMRDFIACGRGQFVSAIRSLLSDEDKRASMGENARRLAEQHYDRAKISSDLGMILRGLVSGRNVRRIPARRTAAVSRPHVLYVTLYLPLQNVHGGGTRMFEQIKFLSAKYTISVISFMRNWEKPSLKHLEPYCSQVHGVAISDRNARSYSLTRPGFIHNYFSPEMQSAIGRAAASGDFDIAQFEYLPMAQYRGCVGASVPCLLTEHQLGFLCLRKQMRAEKNAVKKAELFFRYNRLRAYESGVFSHFDRVIFVSDYEARQAGIRRSFVSPMGVDTEYYAPQAGSSRDIEVLFAANFDNEQNVEAMRYFAGSIWPVIKKKRPRTTMTVVGVQSREKVLFLESAGNISVAGPVADMRAYLNRAKVVIMPARTGGGMRGKILEALSMGAPVVSTSIGAEGFGQDVRAAMKIADDPPGFSCAVTELLDNDRERLTLGSAARSAAEKHHRWEYIFSRMDALYQDILCRD